MGNLIGVRMRMEQADVAFDELGLDKLHNLQC